MNLRERRQGMTSGLNTARHAKEFSVFHSINMTAPLRNGCAPRVHDSISATSQATTKRCVRVYRYTTLSDMAEMVASIGRLASTRSFPTRSKAPASALGSRHPIAINPSTGYGAVGRKEGHYGRGAHVSNVRSLFYTLHCRSFAFSYVYRLWILDCIAAAGSPKIYHRRSRMQLPG